MITEGGQYGVSLSSLLLIYLYGGEKESIYQIQKQKTSLKFTGLKNAAVKQFMHPVVE